MVQLVTIFGIAIAIVILVFQNLTPSLALVVLGQTTGTLPLSLWMLLAISIGSLFTLITYQLVPKPRAYRPMGKRLPKDPAPKSPPPPNRFVDPAAPSTVAPNRFNDQPPLVDGPPPDSYDSDWGTFKAPEQWDDWGVQQSRERPPASREPVADTIQDIESGWVDDDQGGQHRPVGPNDGSPDSGWRDDGYGQDRGDYAPGQRTYDEGWLYGGEPPTPGNPPPTRGPENLDRNLDRTLDTGPEDDIPEDDIYDANYRVIIPPYDAKDNEG